MKKTISALLLLTLCFCLLTVPAWADGEVYSEGYFYYTFADGSITITGYFGKETEVTVPSSIAGYPVNAIAPGAFAGTTVEIIHLPDTIMVVGEGGTGSASVIYSGEQISQTAPEQASTPADEGEASASSGGTDGGSSGGSTASANTEGQSGSTGKGHDEATVEGLDEDESDPQTTDTTVKEQDGVVIATPVPGVEPSEVTLETEETSETESDTETGEKQSSGSGAVIAVIAALAVCGGAAAVFARRKKADGKGEQS